MVSVPAASRPHATESLINCYRRLRGLSLDLTTTLAIEDQVIQTIPEVSPTKWHLGHTTWFFEQFCLSSREQRYAPYDERFHFLFNSYYQTAGVMHARPRRGLLSRPTVAEVRAYREHVDDRMVELLASHADDEELAFLVTLGLHHEQQHQELMLTDIKHVFFSNPLYPVYRRDQVRGPGVAQPLTFERISGGHYEIGATTADFCFDNETPRHTVLVGEFSLANRLVTNAEYAEFMRDGGYEDPTLWLSDGWTAIQSHGCTKPLYWSEDHEREFTLAGWQPIDSTAPVCHVSFYEADAFARWAGHRLPTEAEWEVAAVTCAVSGNFLESERLHPAPTTSADPRSQLFGDVWEWTASPYGPYPSFKPLAGSLGEYNGKFMCNQMVVRGGSCASQRDHLRASYRSFFYPHDRWQFLGLRLATDG
jgi:ergothioneine biosynthesis protein EgtB